MALTLHQQEKQEEILSHLYVGENRILLIGSAGVGKTYMMGELVKLLARDRRVNGHYNNKKIYALAPTNKALAVLKGKIDYEVEFKTVDSALHRRPGPADPKTGIRKFIRINRKSKSAEEFKTCKAAIVDEASMLNSELLTYLDEYRFPIIFVGDNKQINPVGEAESPVFTRGYPTVELTEIVRQKNPNPIIELSRDLDLIYFKQPNVINNRGYLYSNAKHIMIDRLAEVNGTDDLKYLAYTNDEVELMNKLVRVKRYGNPKKIELEETITFNMPYGSFYTNEEVKVRHVDIITDFISVPKEDTRYDKDDNPITEMDKIKMKYYRINESISVVHEQSEAIFKLIVAQLNGHCKNNGWSWNARDYFRDKIFADIKYNHALTIHKSQGSTYKEAIINIGNVLRYCRDANEKQRLLYTGVTRASDLVILNNVM